MSTTSSQDTVQFNVGKFQILKNMQSSNTIWTDPYNLDSKEQLPLRMSMTNKGHFVRMMCDNADSSEHEYRQSKKAKGYEIDDFKRIQRQRL